MSALKLTRMKGISGAAVLLALLLLASCGPASDQAAGEVMDLTLKLSVLDFENPENIEIEEDSEANARMLFPQTERINVQISGSGMTTMDLFFDEAACDYFDPDGDTIWITVPDVPIGYNRDIEVSALDGSSNVLSSASRTVEMDLNKNSVWIRLVPVYFTRKELSDGTITFSDAVSSGKMKLYQVPVGSYDYYTVHLTSDNHDVDLYLYDDDGSLSRVVFRDEEAPYGEHEIVRTWYDNLLYIGVYGGSTGTNLYELEISEEEPRDFDSLFSLSEEVQESYDSIIGTGTEMYTTHYGYEYAIDIPADFDLIFNGVNYAGEKIYVSPNGFASFWNWGFYYWWGYWGLDPATYDWDNWYGWYYIWDYSPDKWLPNNLMAIFMRPLFFGDVDNDGTTDSKIAWDFVTDGDGNEQLIIEYYKMVADYNDDATIVATNRYFSGQIVITESETFSNNFTADAGILFKYDRTNSVMDDMEGFVGVENNVGSDSVQPDYEDRAPFEDDGGSPYPGGVPEFDLAFRYQTGGLDLVLE